MAFYRIVSHAGQRGEPVEVAALGFQLKEKRVSFFDTDGPKIEHGIQCPEFHIFTNDQDIFW